MPARHERFTTRARTQAAMLAVALRAIAFITFALGLACATPATPSPVADADPVAPQADTPAPSAPADDAKATPPAEVIAAAPTLGRDHRSFVACSSDAECGWDDPCKPTRCVEAGNDAVCKDSAPAPGTCSCVAGACTTKPTTAPVMAGPCELGACVVDRAAGKCVADDGGVAPGLRTRPGVDVGPSCDCEAVAAGCKFSWFDEVACASDRDCWVSATPRRHPIARPKKLKGRDFKPCVDGEVAPKCGARGVCVLGPAASC